MSERDEKREIDACMQINFDLSDLFLECNYCINQGVPLFSVKWVSEKLIVRDGERRDHGLTLGTTWHLPGWTDKSIKKNLRQDRQCASCSLN
jgi:hypothetical protein